MNEKNKGKAIQEPVMTDEDYARVKESLRILKKLGDMEARVQHQNTQKEAVKAEKKAQVMDEEKHVFYDPDGVVEFSESVREQVRDDLAWLSGFIREKYGLTIPEIRRLVAEMLTVSI